MDRMGWCHEFGVEIEASCGHPMTAGASACSCSECETVCQGRFEGGCEEVWRRGPRQNAPARTARLVAVSLPVAAVNGAPANGTTLRPSDETQEQREAPAERREGPSVRRLQTALANLAEQVAQQNDRLAVLDQQVWQLAKVLGQLGVEVDHRLKPVEQALDPGVDPPPPKRRS